LVILFFVPLLNLAFFLLLSVIPERRLESAPQTESTSWFAAYIPSDQLGSAAMAVAFTGLIGAAAIYLGTERLGTYGWGIFVAVPFCFGFVSVLIYTYHAPRTLSSCLGVSLMSVGMVGIALLALAIEGLVCIVMALPIAIPLAMFGGAVAYGAQRHRRISAQAPTMLLVVGMIPIGVMGSERIIPFEAPRTSVYTTIRINAPAQRVWKNLIAFSDIPVGPINNIPARRFVSDPRHD
jgi:hypothetical protein